MSQERAQKVLQRLELLAGISDRNDCLCREFGGKASAQVRDIIYSWMQEISLEPRIDNALNIRGLKDFGSTKNFMMGSHLDTVLNAGKYDGILGVMLALDQAQRLEEENIKLPYNFEVVGFSEEEGVRFLKPYLGSLALAGQFKKEYLSLADREGATLQKVLEASQKDPMAIGKDALDPQQMAGFLEVHIEQGPVLDKLQLPLGLVTDIVAQQRHQISFIGDSGHAGTVPLSQRKDALLGASELVLTIENLARKYQGMVATVGALEVFPGKVNVIPQKVNMTLDIRHAHKAELTEAVGKLRNKTSSIARQRGLISYWEAIMEENSVQCDPGLTDHLKTAMIESGFPVKHLVSGAGHDAMIMAQITPVCMLFVRCKLGISHNPKEFASLEDIAAAIKVCDHFFDKLTPEHN